MCEKNKYEMGLKGVFESYPWTNFFKSICWPILLLAITLTLIPLGVKLEYIVEKITDYTISVGATVLGFGLAGFALFFSIVLNKEEFFITLSGEVYSYIQKVCATFVVIIICLLAGIVLAFISDFIQLSCDDPVIIIHEVKYFLRWIYLIIGGSLLYYSIFSVIHIALNIFHAAQILQAIFDSNINKDVDDNSTERTEDR